MSESKLSNRIKFAERVKATKFIRNYYRKHGSFPTVETVNEAKVLTPAETAQVSLDVELSNLVEQSEKESIGVWDYIWSEVTWNAAYNKENSPLKEYLERYPDEDRWNEHENRAAQARDKVDGEWPEWCPQCWKGALNSPGAQYPWCVVNIEPFTGNIRFNYDGGEDVFPWGTEDRTFTRHFAIASIPVELGEEFLLHDGVTTFDPSKLVVTIIEA